MNSTLLRTDSRRMLRVVSAGIFLWMLVMNVLTPYICDDFTYRLNFATAEPLQSVLEIIPSMAAHSHKMNGRLISHGLAQLFMLLPPIVFDVVNSAVFLFTGLLILRLLGAKGNWALLGGLCCLMWLCIPVFGQVALWQVGAVNYFWSLTAFALFITPELLRFREGRRLLTKGWHWVLFCIYSLFFGWYNEIASFVGLCMVFCLIVLDLWMNGKKFEFRRILPILFAAAGYLLMLSAPAQAANKQAEAMTLTLLLRRALVCGWMLVKHGWPLLLLFAVSFVAGFRARLDRNTMLLSALFALAGICANFMPMAASYYPERCLCTTALLLIMAAGFPTAQLLRDKRAAVALAILALVTLPALFTGGRDILRCHQQFAAREAIIAQALEDGITDVTAPVVHPKTGWSGFYGLRDLSTEDPETWPNHSMALYYGLDSLIGK